MSKAKPTSVYVIRQLSTGSLVKFGTKCGGASQGAAKSAFCLHMKYHYRDVIYDTGVGVFDEQNEFVIEEIL